MSVLLTGGGVVPVKTFVFTINHNDAHYTTTEYQADVGMTWAEWCDSKYNTDGYTYDDTYVNSSDGMASVYYGNYTFVTPSDVIEEKTYGLSV